MARPGGGLNQLKLLSYFTEPVFVGIDRGNRSESANTFLILIKSPDAAAVFYSSDASVEGGLWSRVESCSICVYVVVRKHEKREKQE